MDYFLDGVLESAGVKDETKKMNINLGKSCLQFSFVSRTPLTLFQSSTNQNYRLS